MKITKKKTVFLVLASIAAVIILVTFLTTKETIDFDLTKYTPGVRVGILGVLNSCPKEVNDKTIKLEGIVVVADTEPVSDNVTNDVHVPPAGETIPTKMILLMSDDITVGMEYEWSKDLESGSKVIMTGKLQCIDDKTIIKAEKVSVK